MAATELPVRYTVDLADLQLVADAAFMLVEAQQLYVDQPEVQRRLRSMAGHLNDLIERAAGEHAEAIYPDSDEPAP